MDGRVMKLLDKTSKNKKKAEKSKSNENTDDYVYRFTLNTNKDLKQSEEALETFFNDQLLDLLNIVFLSKDGVKIIPNEFGFLNNQEKMYSLKREESGK